jgi:hypothetical protein
MPGRLLGLSNIISPKKKPGARPGFEFIARERGDQK